MIAIAMAAANPVGQGAGVVALIGWLGVALLVVGLVVGIRGSVTAAAVAFVMRWAVAVTLETGFPTPLWATALGLVLMIEFASASFTFRSRPADPTTVLGRAVVVGLGAVGITHTLALFVGVADATGVLVRAVGVAAVVVAAGWVTWTWRKSGLSG
jgi:hypothetical protein